MSSRDEVTHQIARQAAKSWDPHEVAAKLSRVREVIIYVYVYTYILLYYTHTHTHTHTRIYVYTYTHTYTYKHAYIRMIRMYVCI